MKLEVLIVDDDVMMGLIHKKMVVKTNFHAAPLSFLNGKAALDHILNNNTADKTYFVLLDINMPLMNGWQFLEAVKHHEILVRIYVVIISSSVDAIDKEKAASYPVVIDFWEKPIGLSTVEELKKKADLKIFFDFY